MQYVQRFDGRESRGVDCVELFRDLRSWRLAEEIELCGVHGRRPEMGRKARFADLV